MQVVSAKSHYSREAVIPAAAPEVEERRPTQQGTAEVPVAIIV
jgi:hypothetical protein